MQAHKINIFRLAYAYSIGSTFLLLIVIVLLFHYFIFPMFLLSSFVKHVHNKLKIAFTIISFVISIFITTTIFTLVMNNYKYFYLKI